VLEIYLAEASLRKRQRRKKNLISEFALAAKSIDILLIQVADYILQELPATSCTPTNLNGAVQIRGTNIQFVGNSSSSSGNTVQLNVEYPICIICLSCGTDDALVQAAFDQVQRFNAGTDAFLIAKWPWVFLCVCLSAGCISTYSIDKQWANCGASQPEEGGNGQLYGSPRSVLLHIRSDIHRERTVIEFMDARRAVDGCLATALVQVATDLDPV
jgi:hypothetical protein